MHHSAGQVSRKYSRDVFEFSKEHPFDAASIRADTVCALSIDTGIGSLPFRSVKTGCAQIAEALIDIASSDLRINTSSYIVILLPESSRLCRSRHNGRG